MNQSRKINPIPFGLIYFVMFLFSFFLDQGDKIIHYPLIKDGFAGELYKWGVGIGVGFFVVFASQAVSTKVKWMQDLGHEFFRLMGQLKKEEIFYLAFFSSVGEEFLFRGIIQGHFGLITASLIFGLLHTAPGKKGMVWSGFALLMGFVLGGLYMWSQSIFVPIWTHFIINYFNIYYLQKALKKIN